jgi:hippurate hydrolase
MPVLNRIADYSEDMTAWRRQLHQHPELAFDCHITAAFIADRLREFGVDEIHEGIATSGIVAIINGQGPGPTIGLRADMDALPIDEITGADHSSTVPGKMHACGHDGHVTMLLGAAKYLCETRRFAVDTAYVHVTGRGGHGATPHEAVDPVVAIVGMVSALQTIISRNLHTLDDLVLSITQIHTGTASNIIPEEGWFCATIRTFSPEVRQMVQRRFHEIVEGHAAAYGVEVRIDYEIGYPPTVNHPAETGFAAEVAREIAGADGVDDRADREMGSEDFAYMLEARPGAYLFLGTGPGAGLHHPAFDFNDEAAPIGASFFARLVERAQPLG